MAQAGFDYVIVGAGSAGCVLANRLSADPAARVLLLEAGGSDTSFWIRLPSGTSARSTIRATRGCSTPNPAKARPAATSSGRVAG